MVNLMKAGIVLGVLGALALFASQGMLDGCSTALGEVGQALSEDMRNRCSNGMMLRNAGGAALVIGLGLLGYGYVDQRFEE